ncbi:MAG TPA: type II toxin-antitoxin system RelE/ParE family toxin [Pyrinomonadaceae bacterium]
MAGFKEIYNYIAIDDPTCAQRTILNIFEKAQLLTTQPEIGYRYEVTGRSVRILLYGHYRIAYFVKTDGKIDILGVFHGALDIQRYLT